MFQILTRRLQCAAQCATTELSETSKTPNPLSLFPVDKIRRFIISIKHIDGAEQKSPLQITPFTPQIMVETHHTTPVLVVGGGPIGLMTAYQLARLDVPCLLA